MKRRRIMLAAVLGVFLIILSSAVGTLAYLTKTTEKAVNTFTIGKLFADGSDGLSLLEHRAVDQNHSGLYVLDMESEVTSNQYTVFPGVSIPKDSFVRINGIQIPAYLFLEVVDTTPEEISFAVNETNWSRTDIRGSHNGAVYSYAGNSGIIAEDAEIEIIQNNCIDVAKKAIGNTGNVSFYVYLVQSIGVENAEAAWSAVGS